VPELRPRSVAVIVCSADAAALAALVRPGHSTRMLRTAPDEALFLSSPDVADAVTRELRDRISALDDDALVLDVSDGWAAWSITGDDTARAFSYLSALEAPEPAGAIQGDVARVGAKVLGEEDGLTILVPAYWSEHIRERAIRDARATEVRA
jgi:hypothetical protein